MPREQLTFELPVELTTEEQIVPVMGKLLRDTGLVMETRGRIVTCRASSEKIDTLCQAVAELGLKVLERKETSLA